MSCGKGLLLTWNSECVGCLAKVGLPDFIRFNDGSKTSDTVFVGYSEISVAYSFTSLNDHSICESRDAEFF